MNTGWKKRKYGIFLAGALIVLFEVIGHGFFPLERAEQKGIRQWVQNFSPYTLFKNKPNSFVMSRGVASRYPSNLSTDKYGFVHNGYSRVISDDDFTIFILGGSTVEGRGASSNSRTIAACLERILNDGKLTRHNKIKVINAGMVGFNSFLEFNLLFTRIAPGFKPDMVISLNGRNDWWYLVDGGWQPQSHPYQDDIEREINSFINSNYYRAKMVLGSCLEYSIIHRMLTRLLGSPPEPTKRSYGASIKEYALNYANNLKLCKRLSDLGGFTYFAFLQPALAPSLKASFSTHETNWTRRFYGSRLNWERHMGAADRFYAASRKQLENCDWHHDISKIFLHNKEGMYHDSCHYNDVGSEIIAMKIASMIRDRKPGTLPGLYQ